MTIVLTLFGYIPPARFDGTPWTSARIQQSSSESGTYALVEQIPLSPVDADPANPLARSFTTDAATAGDWFRIIWVDGNGDLSDPTEPVHLADTSTTAYGTTAELASLLNIRTPTTEQTTSLERVLLVASGEINHEIGRSDLATWELALAAEVALERAAEHWAQLKSPFGFVGVAVDAPFIAARDSWERHAFKLSPLKGSWGIA